MPDENEITEEVPLDEDVIQEAFDEVSNAGLESQVNYLEGVINEGDDRIISQVDELGLQIRRFEDTGGRVDPDGTNGGVISVLKFDDEVRDIFRDFTSSVEGVILKSNQDMMERLDRRQKQQVQRTGANGGGSGRGLSVSNSKSMRVERGDEEWADALRRVTEDTYINIDADDFRETLEGWERESELLKVQRQADQKVADDLERMASIEEAEQWAIETIGEELKGEVALFRKQEYEANQKAVDEAAKREQRRIDEEEQRAKREAKERYDERSDVQLRGRVRDVSGTLTGLGNDLNTMTRDPGKGIQGMLGRFSELIGDTAGMSSTGEGTGLAGMLEGAGLGRAAGALNTVGSVLGTAVPIIGAVLAGGALIGNGLDVAQNMRNEGLQQGTDQWTTGAGMTAQAIVSGFTSGLSQSDVEGIQRTLVRNRAEWGTREYDQGFNFAMDAAQNRGINATRAAQYYTDMVVKGGESMATLNERMDALSDTTQNTALGMDEMTKIVTDAANGFSRMTELTGGNELTSTGMALDVMDIFSNIEGITGYETQVAQGMASQIDFGNYMFSGIYSQAFEETGGDEGAATLLATTRILSDPNLARAALGRNRQAVALMYPIVPGSASFLDYFANDDWEGMENALQELYSIQRNDETGVTWGTLTAYLKTAFKLDDATTRDPKAIADQMRVIKTGSSNVESGTYDSGADINEIASETEAQYLGTNKTLLDSTPKSVDFAPQDLSHSIFGEGFDAAQRERLTNEVMRNGGASISAGYTSAGEFNLFDPTTWGLTGGVRNDSTGMSVLKYMNDAGILQMDDWSGLTESSAQALVNDVNRLYEMSGMTTNFTDWVKGEGRSSLEEAVSRSVDRTEQARQVRQQVDVNITLGYEDGVDRDIHARVERVNRQDGMDAGIDG